MAVVTAAETEQEPATPRRRGWARRHPVVTVVLGVFLLLLLCGALPLALAAPPLLAAEDAARRGQAAIPDGDFEAAGAALADAEAEFRSARRLLHNPIATLGGLVPGVGHNLRAAGAVARAGELGSGAAVGVYESIDALPGGSAAFSPRGGALPVDALEAASGPLAAAATRLAEARELISESPGLLLVAPVADARAQLGEQLAAVVPVAEEAATLAAVLPDFLGADGPRTYFFGAATPGELRGSGGWIGAHSLVTIDDGRLSFADFGATGDLPPVPDVEAPNADYARYDRYQRDNRWRSMNLTPDFTVVGTLIERLYAQAPGEELDGVIVADPFALQALLRVAGPTEVPGFGRVNANTVVQFVTVDAYGEFTDAVERKEVLGAVAAAALQGFLEEGGDPLSSLRALAGAVEHGHLLLHAADPVVQEGFETAGVAGDLPSGSTDALIIAANSSTNAKVDAFLEADLRYEVTLRPEGAAEAHVSLALHNDAPTAGVDRYVIGPSQRDFEAGENRFYLQVFGAPDGEVTGFSVDGERVPARIEEERDLPVVVTDVQMLSGESRDVEVSTTAPAAWTGDEDRLTYRLALTVPPLLRGVNITVRVSAPAGMTLVDSPPGAEVTGGSVEVHLAEARGQQELQLTYARPAAGSVRQAVRDFLTRPVFRLDR